jgi:hypothetical protein
MSKVSDQAKDIVQEALTQLAKEKVAKALKWLKKKAGL